MHGGQEVGNMHKMEINSGEEKKKLATSHMTIILSDGFAVQMKICSFLPHPQAHQRETLCPGANGYSI